MATPAQRTNTWTLDEWYDQSVAGTTGGYNGISKLYTWGRNQYGVCATNTAAPTSYQNPQLIPGSTSW